MHLVRSNAFFLLDCGCNCSVLERQLSESQFQLEDQKLRLAAATAEREHMSRMLEREEKHVPQLQSKLRSVCAT